MNALAYRINYLKDFVFTCIALWKILFRSHDENAIIFWHRKVSLLRHKYLGIANLETADAYLKVACLVVYRNQYNENSAVEIEKAFNRLQICIEEHFGDKNNYYLAHLLLLLGFQQERLHNLDQAESFYRSSYRMFEKTGRCACPQYADALHGIARIIDAKGNYKRSQMVANKANEALTRCWPLLPVGVRNNWKLYSW